MSILANMWFVLLGLAEKIRYLFVYDKQDVIMYPAKQVNVLQKHSSKKISVDEEKEEMEGDATELTVLSYNINRLFAYHDPKKIERTIEFFNALFQLPWRSTKPTQASSLAAPVDATIDTSGCNVTQAPDVICVQEAWEESVSSRLLQIAAMHGWYAARPSTVKRLFVGEATGLLTFSKFKILQQNTTIYSHRSGSDWLSNKGAQYLTLQLRDIRRAAGSQAPPSLLHLVNTHLNASPIVDAVTEVSSAAAVALRQMHQLLTHLPPAHRLQGCLLVGDLNLQPAEVQVFVDQYAASHGARAVTTHGRLDRYVSFPEERSQLDYCLTLRGVLPAKTTDAQTPASSAAVLDMTRDKLPLEKPASVEPAAHGWWGEGSTRLVRDPRASDHLPILTHVRWVPSRG